MLPVIAHQPAAVDRIAGFVVPVLTEVIAGFKVRGRGWTRAWSRNPILVTALNPVIGYEAAAKIAKRAYAEGRPVLDVAREMTSLTEKQLRKLLDPG
jgi:fumarate hydratase class II